MIINIQNVLQTSQLSPAVLAGVASTSGFTAQLDAYYYRDCMKQALLTAVVYCDKSVRGVCVCKRSMIPDSCEIDSICIEDGFRRKGLGKKLLAHSLRNMRSMRIRTAYIWVDDSNCDAAAFLAAFGFTPDGKRHSGGSRFKIDIY
ncbi:MAG: GNAT family N-acetyltransferase [Oscillospiraceae bacterium]|nr:GNAT family N-acetyltransferase [Oscillospiraceae bacterium]